ncbi:MAG: transposase [Phenylobacterium sp.]|uniref:IS66-like element accessory protein TnpA n=1 Tax=Phenylobacterium sp. TaxID=1871053 RepID=UPI00271EC77C|nr:transposase [Phenylobacterium sp.]MDO8911196.1 transposase [Phenylobacterium sp.]
MVDHMFQHMEARRFELRTGGGRRRWTTQQKATIVSESFAPGAVADVARRHDLTPQHLFAWRGAAKRGELVLPADGELSFVPVMIEDAGRQGQRRHGASLEIEVAGVVVRLSDRVDLGWLTEVVRALKAAA